MIHTPMIENKIRELLDRVAFIAHKEKKINIKDKFKKIFKQIICIRKKQRREKKDGKRRG